MCNCGNLPEMVMDLVKTSVLPSVLFACIMQVYSPAWLARTTGKFITTPPSAFLTPVPFGILFHLMTAFWGRYGSTPQYSCRVDLLWMVIDVLLFPLQVTYIPVEWHSNHACTLNNSIGFLTCTVRIYHTGPSAISFARPEWLTQPCHWALTGKESITAWSQGASTGWIQYSVVDSTSWTSDNYNKNV